MSVIVTSLVNYSVTLTSPAYVLKPFETKIFTDISALTSDLVTKDGLRMIQAEVIVNENLDDGDGLILITGTPEAQTAFNSLVSGAVNGFVGADRATLIYLRDHPVKQTLGDATHASMHQWFKDYGLWPYSLTTCTETNGGSSPTVGDSQYKLTWAQIKQLQDDGVEITNHANRHIGHLARLCTGFGLKYTGANATATAYVTASPRTLVLVDSGTTSFDLTNASYDTLTKLYAAVKAVPGWTCSIADELDGSERSSDTLIVATPGKNCKNAFGQFAVSGGLLVRYKGSAYRTAFVRILTGGGYIQFFGDGVLVAEYDFSSGSYNTLAKVATAGAALDSGDWEVGLLDGAGVSPYCDGSEATVGNMVAGNPQDCYHRYVWITAGLPTAQVWRKALKRARDVAAGYGVVMQNFSDVGTGAWDQALWQLSEFTNLPRCTNVYATIAPAAVPAYSCAAVPVFTYDDNTTTKTDAQTAAVIDALADSPGHLVSTFLHQILVDGSSGRSFLDFDAANGPGYQYEAKMLGVLQRVKAQTDARKLNILTQQGMFSVRGRMTKPPNFIFNARWRNSGNTAGAESLAGVASTDQGSRIPGWRFATPNVSAIAINADGEMTLTTTAASASNYFTSMVWLEAGKTYHVGLVAETLAYTSGTGISVTLLPLAGYEYQSEITSGQGLNMDEYAGSAASVHRYFNAAFTIPTPARKRAFVRSRAGGTFNLSTNKNIRINFDNIGQTADIDCSAGAASAAAVYAWEIAAAINAAVKATAAYAAKSEYHNCARAENGRLIIEAPYASFSTTSGARTVLAAGSTVSATTAIFGTTGGTTHPVGYFSTSGQQGLMPYLFSIIVNAAGTFRLVAPVIKEIEGVH